MLSYHASFSPCSPPIKGGEMGVGQPVKVDNYGVSKCTTVHDRH